MLEEGIGSHVVPSMQCCVRQEGDPKSLGGKKGESSSGSQCFSKSPVVQPIRAFDPRRYHDPRPMVTLGEAKRKGPATKPISFKPSEEGSNDKWVKPVDGRKSGQGKWQSFEVGRGSQLAYCREFQANRRTFHVSENCKGKNI